MTEKRRLPHLLAADFVRQKLNELSTSNNAPKVRATLARLRRGVSLAPGADPDIWDVTLAEIPAEIASLNGEPTRGEWAIQTALTLFALHQQGRNIKTECMHHEDIDAQKDDKALKTATPKVSLDINAMKAESSKPHSFGSAVRRLAGDKESDSFKAVRRRFNATVTSESIEEFAHHLRCMVQLMKAAGIRLDYVALAREIYLFQNPDNRDTLRLRWGQDFYR